MSDNVWPKKYGDINHPFPNYHCSRCEIILRNVDLVRLIAEDGAMKVIHDVCPIDPRATIPDQPKFRVEQIVFIDDLGFYGLVRGRGQCPNEKDDWVIQTTPSGHEVTIFPESDLRALSELEIGR